MGLTPGNPMARVLMVLLVFEAVVFGLAIPGMIVVNQVPAVTAGVAGGGAELLALVAAGTLRRAFGYPLGWVTQVVGIALGFLTAWMFGLGGLFALLWVVTFALGRRLDAAR